MYRERPEHTHTHINMKKETFIKMWRDKRQRQLKVKKCRHMHTSLHNDIKVRKLLKGEQPLKKSWCVSYLYLTGGDQIVDVIESFLHCFTY